MITYTHYGSDHFYIEYFIPIRNEKNSTKPTAGSGLWASRTDDKHGWEKWCKRNHFDIEHLNSSFCFTLLDANILLLEDPEQLLALPKLHEWKPKMPPDVKPGEIPTPEQLRIWFEPNWCYLDFEKLAEEYDAIELRNSGAFNDALATWDCDCILVMNPEKIREV